MKDVIEEAVPPQVTGHTYTAAEVQIRLARLEDSLRDMSTIRASIFGNMGFSGASGFSGSLSHYSGHSGIYSSPRPRNPFEQLITTDKIIDEQSLGTIFYDEGFIAKGIRELKEFFQALFVKIVNKKEIEHGK